jgi:cytochrome c biogenesis protein CcmG/thiol:disulfide interchange protein DsbE
VSARSLAAFIGVLAVLGLLGYGLLSKGSSDLETGAVVPVDPLPALGSSSELSLADFRGKWVLVNFWASWCEPCRTESPALERFHRENRRRGFTVLGIDTQDLTGDGLAFVREFGLTYPHLRDADGDAADAWGTTGVPESFLVDPGGRLRISRRGPVDAEYLDQVIAPELPEMRG